MSAGALVPTCLNVFRDPVQIPGNAIGVVRRARIGNKNFAEAIVE
jgi:hypothetical protein